MKYFATLLAAAAVANAAAKSLSTYMPDCAVPCLTSAISAATTCKGPEDLECFCIADNYRAIYDNAVACVLQRCGDDVAIRKSPPKHPSLAQAPSPLTFCFFHSRGSPESGQDVRGGGCSQRPTRHLGGSPGPSC
jgi:hypothetical protein